MKEGCIYKINGQWMKVVKLTDLHVLARPVREGKLGQIEIIELLNII